MSTPPRAEVFFDDLHVGQQFVSRDYALDVADIKAFASQFDPQPFHLDPEAATRTFFGGLAASGWHTAAITMRLLVESVPLAGGLIGSGGEVQWPRPTRPGDVLTVTSTIVELVPSRSRPDRGAVHLRSETRNQRGEIAQVLNARLVARRRGP